MKKALVLGVLVVAATSIARSEAAGAVRLGDRGQLVFTDADDTRSLCTRAKQRGYVPEGDVCSDALNADVDGDGRDLVLLYGRPITGAAASLRAYPETLKVVRAGGATVAARLKPSIPMPGIVAVGNVNATPGDELFIYGSWISSGAQVDVYSLYAGKWINAGGKLFFGGDSADRYGFDCIRKPVPEILQRDYSLIGPTIYGRWRVTTYAYVWDGPMLRLANRATTVEHGLPDQRAIRPGAGCDPLPGYR